MTSHSPVITALMAAIGPTGDVLRAAGLRQISMDSSANRVYRYYEAEAANLQRAIDAVHQVMPQLRAAQITAVTLPSDRLVITASHRAAAVAVMSAFAVLTHPEHTHAETHTITSCWGGLSPTGHLITVTSLTTLGEPS